MSDSKQLDILKRLTAHLAGITPANGYEFDMTNKVFRGRLFYGEDDPIPMLSILENPDADVTVPNAVGQTKVVGFRTWSLLIQGWTTLDPDNPLDSCYQLKAAVEERLSRLIVKSSSTYLPLYPSEYLLGLAQENVTNGLVVGHGLVSPPTEVVSYPSFFIPVGLGLKIDYVQPFVT